jgi:hypothetical protein
MAITNTTILATSTIIYTSSGQSAITSVIICNTATYDPANPLTGLTYLSLHAVKSGQSDGPVNKIVNQLPIPAGETVNFDSEKLVLDNGDQLIAYSAVPANLVSTVSSLPV